MRPIDERSGSSSPRLSSSHPSTASSSRPSRRRTKSGTSPSSSISQPGRDCPCRRPNTQALWRQQGVQAPGYYLAAAALTAWIDQSDFPDIYARANPHRAIGEPGAQANRNYLVHHRRRRLAVDRLDSRPAHGAALFSVLLGAVTLWAGYRAVAPILGERQALHRHGRLRLHSPVPLHQRRRVQ